MSEILATQNYQILLPVGSKIRAARGLRSRKAIVELSGGKFTEQNLYGWEKDKWKPEPRDVPVLAEALGVEIADITQPIKLDE